MGKTDESLYKKYSQNPVNTGRMNGPCGSAWIKGLCGDTMEMYIVVKDKRITDIRFHTDGCESTLACGSITTNLAIGEEIQNALAISPKQIIDTLQYLPEENHHCAILAVSTLHKAIADYMLNY